MSLPLMLLSRGPKWPSLLSHPRPRAEGCRRGDHCLAFVIGGALGAKDSEDRRPFLPISGYVFIVRESLFAYYPFLLLSFLCLAPSAGRRADFYRH